MRYSIAIVIGMGILTIAATAAWLMWSSSSTTEPLPLSADQEQAQRMAILQEVSATASSTLSQSQKENAMRALHPKNPSASTTAVIDQNKIDVLRSLRSQ